MQSVCHYFGVQSSHQLQWAHAVNHRSLLDTVVENPSIHLAVGNVYYADADAFPVLAHPWQDIADLDLVTFTQSLAAVNKGFKLDFASPQAVEPSLELLQRLKLDIPVVLHANVFSLLPEFSSDESGMEPEQFIGLCQSYCPKAVISLGWSLKREYDADGRVEDALIQQMAEMTLKRLGLYNYYIEIRGGYTAGWERGAAVLFDPMPLPTPATNPEEGRASNVISLASRRAA